MSERKFETRAAVRERVPLLIGLAGPSGSGKTYSALRIATGMQRVVGGDIHVIDTESRRALHYADSFKFKHTPMPSPFSPDDYRAALEHVTGQGASIVIVDSMSHEHEGPGGVLEWHERELDRMAGNDFQKRNRMTFAAWAKPKAARRALINAILQLGINAVFCFRAKKKLKILRGKDPVELGWMPIAGEEFVFEMTAHALLYPGSGGVPTWQTEQPGEREMMKLPEQFASIFADPKPLSEEIGESLAKWAAGDEAEPGDLTAALDEIGMAPHKEALARVAARHRPLKWTADERRQIKKAIDERTEHLKTEDEPEQGKLA